MKLQSKEKSLRLFRHSRKCRSCGDPGPRGLFAGHLNNMRHSCDHHILNTFKYICTISHFETTGVKKSLLCLKDNATGFLHFFPITCCGLWLSFSLQYVNHVSFFYAWSYFRLPLWCRYWQNITQLEWCVNRWQRKVAYGRIILNTGTDWQSGWQLPLMHGHPTTPVTAADTLFSKLFSSMKSKIDRRHSDFLSSVVYLCVHGVTFLACALYKYGK